MTEAANAPQAPPDAPVVLVVGSGYRPYREYILRSVSSHYRLWLLDSRAATWQTQYVVGATQVDTRDSAALTAAAREVAGRLPVAGVFTYDESQVVNCARLAEDLGLPGSPVQTIRACRDKAATRAALSAAGLPQPASRTVDTVAEACAAAEEIGYPVVVKARSLAGSYGVVRADDRAAVEAAFATADGAEFFGLQRHDTGRVLVEEMMTGQEISVDAVIHKGEVLVTVIARKHVGMAPYFEEMGHDVYAADPLLSDPELLDQLQRIHQTLGFSYGATHSEFMLTAAGPRLVEVNARLGGELIPYLGHLALGSNPVLAAVRVSVGECPDTEPRHHKAAGVRFLYPADHVETVEVVVHQDRFGPTIHETGVTTSAGDRLALPPVAHLNRYGHVIAWGDDIEQVKADLVEADRLIELVATPITP
jgi:biotin carboxylase